MGILGVLTDAEVRDDGNLTHYTSLMMAASSVLYSFCGGLRDVWIDIYGHVMGR